MTWQQHDALRLLSLLLLATERRYGRAARGGARREWWAPQNFFRHYLFAADAWTLFDNTAAPARRIAWREVGSAMGVGDNAIWRQLTARYMKPRADEESPRRVSEPSWTSEDVLDAVNRAVTAALKRHKERGESIVQWREGRIVTIKPEDIEV